MADRADGFVGVKEMANHFVDAFNVTQVLRRSGSGKKQRIEVGRVNLIDRCVGLDDVTR